MTKVFQEDWALHTGNSKRGTWVTFPNGHEAPLGRVSAEVTKAGVTPKGTLDIDVIVVCETDPSDLARAFLIAHAPRMMRMLMFLEWSETKYEGDDDSFGARACCPVCHAMETEAGERKHRADCELDAIIRDTRSR